MDRLNFSTDRYVTDTVTQFEKTRHGGGRMRKTSRDGQTRQSNFREMSESLFALGTASLSDFSLSDLLHCSCLIWENI
jgi:hypothetical protein